MRDGILALNTTEPTLLHALQWRTIHSAIDRLLPWHVVVRAGHSHRRSSLFSGRVSLFVGYVTYRSMWLEVARLELLRRQGAAHGQDGIDRG